jgi:peptidyl-prolyl cis-trans isomerase D
MLQSFGDKVKGSKVLSYLIIGIISVPFALFGIQSYLGGYGEPVAATVNETEISVRELDREAQNQRQRLAQNFGGKIPEAFDTPELFRNQALDSLIKKKVLEQYLDQYKYAISNQDLSSKILEDENYLKDGKFDKEFYEAQIASLGYSVPQFEMVMREYARLNQIQNGIISSSFILTSENDRLTNLKNQKRALTYYELKSADFTEQVTVSDSEIETYYDKNKTRYKYPEKVKIDYIELKISEVANQINVTEDDIKAQYETNKELYKSKETRNASHILLKVRSSDDDSARDAIKEKILTLKARIESGEDFADVAKAESQDIG